MNKYIILLSLLGFVFLAAAQEQIENPGFETWDGAGASLEPVDWSSLKTSDNTFLAQSAPQVLFQDAGRINGFSVKLENKSALGIVANGIITNGRVHADLDPNNGYVFTNADPKWNTPFSSRPDSIVGWYKYQPASSGGSFDKGKVEVLLHKTTNGQNPVGSTAGNMIAKARHDIIAPAANWVRFSAPFNYTSTDNPDYILLVLTSGDSTNALAGSIAWFDDLELIYNTSSMDNNQINPLQIAQQNDNISIKNMQEGSHFTIINASGQNVYEGTAKSGETRVAMYETGIYFVRIASSKGIITRKIAFVKD